MVLIKRGASNVSCFFDDCLVKKGVVTSRGLETSVALLDMAKVEVTVEELQPNVASLHPTGECALSVAISLTMLLLSLERIRMPVGHLAHLNFRRSTRLSPPVCLHAKQD